MSVITTAARGWCTTPRHHTRPTEPMPLTAKQKALYFATDTNGTLTGEVDAPPIGRGAHQKILRRPGQIDGQQFIVENLHGCTVHCLDHCAQVTIDKCTDCTFVIGPCADSIFARDCTGCDFGAVCQQWRTRDCRCVPCARPSRAAARPAAPWSPPACLPALARRTAGGVRCLIRRRMHLHVAATAR
jgi:hypothetical protein